MPPSSSQRADTCWEGPAASQRLSPRQQLASPSRVRWLSAVDSAVELACTGLAHKARAALSGLSGRRHDRWCCGNYVDSRSYHRTRTRSLEAPPGLSGPTVLLRRCASQDDTQNHKGRTETSSRGPGLMLQKLLIKTSRHHAKPTYCFFRRKAAGDPTARRRRRTFWTKRFNC